VKFATSQQDREEKSLSLMCNIVKCEVGYKQILSMLHGLAIESPTSTSSALVKTDLLPEVDTTETESSINASSALVITDYCQK
jgi:hypothetical protein